MLLDDRLLWIQYWFCTCLVTFWSIIPSAKSFIIVPYIATAPAIWCKLNNDCPWIRNKKEKKQQLRLASLENSANRYKVYIYYVCLLSMGAHGRARSHRRCFTVTTFFPWEIWHLCVICHTKLPFPSTSIITAAVDDYPWIRSRCMFSLFLRDLSVEGAFRLINPWISIWAQKVIRVARAT